MPTKKKRLNLTLSPDIEAALTALAKRDAVPPAAKALYLLEFALTVEEDDLWNDIAEKRDLPGAKRVSHEEAWA